MQFQGGLNITCTDCFISCYNLNRMILYSPRHIVGFSITLCCLCKACVFQETRFACHNFNLIHSIIHILSCHLMYSRFITAPYTKLCQAEVFNCKQSWHIIAKFVQSCFVTSVVWGVKREIYILCHSLAYIWQSWLNR